MEENSLQKRMNSEGFSENLTKTDASSDELIKDIQELIKKDE